MLKVGRYLSPMEIKEQKFEQRFRGYDVQEVDDFLRRLSADYEALYKERQELAEQTDTLKEELARYKKLEENVQQALVTAQQAAKQVAENARQQGELIVKQARFEAAQEKAKASSEVERAAEKLAVLNNQAIAFRAQLRTLVNSFQELLEGNAQMANLSFLEAAPTREEERNDEATSALPEEGTESESDSRTARPSESEQDGDIQSTTRFNVESFNNAGK
jgi:cell division initiation protein